MSTGFCSPGTARPLRRWWHRLPATAIAVKTPTISTASGHDGSMDQSLLHEANRSRGSRGPGSSESGAAGDEGILRGDRALCQCRGSGASGEHSRHGRGRSQPQPHQLGVTSGRALMKSAAGDSVVLEAPGGTEYLTVLEVRYERISVEPFREPPGSEASAKGLPRRGSPDEEETMRHRS